MHVWRAHFFGLEPDSILVENENDVLFCAQMNDTSKVHSDDIFDGHRTHPSVEKELGFSKLIAL